MKELLFEFSDLQIWKEDDIYFAVYDAGAHQVMMRKDEITKEDVTLACEGNAGANEMLQGLQNRLIEKGIDPYQSNYQKEQ